MHSEEVILPQASVMTYFREQARHGATDGGTHQNKHAVSYGGGLFVGETLDLEHTTVREDLATDVHVLDDSLGLPFEHLFRERIRDDTDAEVRSSDGEHDVTGVGITSPRTIILRFPTPVQRQACTQEKERSSTEEHDAPHWAWWLEGARHRVRNAMQILSQTQQPTSVCHNHHDRLEKVVARRPRRASSLRSETPRPSPSHLSTCSEARQANTHQLVNDLVSKLIRGAMLLHDRHQLNIGCNPGGHTAENGGRAQKLHTV